MKIDFVKMQGIGNDYIFVDSINNKLPEDASSLGEMSRKVSDRHFGIGSDGLILIAKGITAEFKMRMFNSDGSEAEMCGNGLRCFAKYLFDRGLVSEKEFWVETWGGLHKVKVLDDEKKHVTAAQIKMGFPNFNNTDIPINNPEAKETLNFLYKIEDKENGIKSFKLNCVTFGNPHCVIFLEREEDIKDYLVKKFGSIIENNIQLFPKKINVEFVKIISNRECVQRTWERGCGETLGCGTGATAVFAVGRKLGIFERKIIINLLGGDLELSEDKKTKEILLTGPVVEVFTGHYSI